MGNLNKKVVIWIALMIHALYSSAVNDVRVGRAFSSEELATSVFTSLCMDASGFLWIGTDNGLFRFDGTHFYPYRRTEADSASISDNRILGILNDRSDRIWIATANGLNLYDTATNSFRRVAVKDFGENGYIISMTDNGDAGVAFVVSGVGIFNVSVEKKGVFRVEEIKSTENIKHANCILAHRDGSLYAGTTYGEVYEIPSGKKPRKIVKMDSAVGDMAEELDGSLLVHTENGLFRIRVDTGVSRKIRLGSGKKVNSLSANVGSRIYIATFGDGVWYVDNNSDSAEDCSDLYSSKLDVGDAKVGAVFGDPVGRLWVGCDFFGILMFPPKRIPFLYRKIASVSQSFNSPVSSMDVWKGNAVVGNHEGKIMVMAEDGTLLKEICMPSEGVVSSINVIENDKALIGIQNGGVWEIDLTTWKIKEIVDIPGKYLSVLTCPGNDGSLYVGVYGIGLLRYDPVSGKKTWVSRDSDGRDLIPTFFTTIKPQGYLLWIGLYGGFACYDTSSGRFLEIDQDPFVAGATYAVEPENERSVLVGTSNGLIRYDPVSGKSERFTTNDGLADNDVRSITIDKTGSLWIGTMHGLTRIDNDFKDIKAYSGGHGIEETVFERMGYSEDADRIFATGRLGITALSPDSLSPVEFESPLRISSIYLKGMELNQSSMINGKRVIEGNVGSPEVLNLPFNENSIVLSLSTMDFRDTSNMNWLWRMGEGEGWNVLPKGTDMIHLPSLRPGRYKLEFKAREADVESSVSSVMIRVAQPWYFTWPAKMIYIMIILVLVAMTVVLVRKRRVELINERRMQFFMDVSHDIRSPLTLMINPLESLLKEPLEAAVHNKIRIMYRSAYRILNLVNQLLDLKSKDYGKKVLECRPTFLPGFVGEIVEMFRPQALEKGIVLVYDRGHDVAEVWIDRTVVDRILVNLISNAIKYTPEKGRIDISLRSRTDRKMGDCVEIIVKDTGIGFGVSPQKDLFTPFHRLENGRSFSDEGYGLGLDICRRYAALHHGAVNGENRKDGIEGSVFTVLIPSEKCRYSSDELVEGVVCPECDGDEMDLSETSVQGRSSERGVSNGSEEGKRKRGRYTECRVLVVEDDRELREALFAYLNGFFKVLSACDGSEGYRLAQEFKPDVVVTDVVMPNTDGLQLLRKLKSNPATMHMPVLMLSSKSDVADRLAGWRIGAEGYLGKPFDFNELRVVVRNLIEGRAILKGKLPVSSESETVINPPVSWSKGNDDSLMERIAKILDEKIDEEDMNVDRLAQEVGLSRSQLYRRLKEGYGMNPSDLIRNIRLKRACELLKTANLDITQIAYKLGFSSQSQFSTTFKRFMGYTPSEYRMKHTGDAGLF